MGLFPKKSRSLLDVLLVVFVVCSLCPTPLPAHQLLGESVFKGILHWPSFLGRWHVTQYITSIQQKVINGSLAC